MKRTRILITVLAAAALLILTSQAQERSKEKDTKMPAGFRGEFLAQLGDVEKKIVDLAQAVPGEKYSWRPAEGVRSVSEVYMHIAVANYLLMSFIGIKPPEGIRDQEKTVTEKAKVVEMLKKSFDHVRNAAMKTADADLDKPATFFGQETTVRGIFFNAALHMHEHMGQSIAYARSNGVVPPWTMAQQASEQQGTKK